MLCRNPQQWTGQQQSTEQQLSLLNTTLFSWDSSTADQKSTAAAEKSAADDQTPAAVDHAADQ